MPDLLTGRRAETERGDDRVACEMGRQDVPLICNQGMGNPTPLTLVASAFQIEKGFGTQDDFRPGRISGVQGRGCRRCFPCSQEGFEEGVARLCGQLSGWHIEVATDKRIKALCFIRN